MIQSRSNQNSVVFAQNQKYGSMEQNTEPRNKPTHLRKNIQWRKDASSANGNGKLETTCKSNEVRTHSHDAQK